MNEIQKLIEENRARPIPSFPKYLATTDGCIYSTIRNIWLKQRTLNKGHKYICPHNSKNKQLVHRLVLETFAGPCPEGMEACHINDDPANNHIYNLRWDTRSENYKDRVRNGTWFNPTQLGEDHYRCKLTEEQVKEIRSLYSTGKWSQRKLAKKYSLGKTTVAHIIHRDSWKHI